MLQRIAIWGRPWKPSSSEDKAHPEDIQDLSRHCLRKFHKDSASRAPSLRREAVKFLEKQPWPGNVRELENAVRRAVLLAQGQPIGVNHVEQACEPLDQTGQRKRRAGEDTPTDLIARARNGEIDNAYARFINQAQLLIIKKAMAIGLGSKAKAARLLGIRRGTLRRKLRELGL